MFLYLSTLLAFLMIASQPANTIPAVDLQKLEIERKHKEGFYKVLNDERAKAAATAATTSASGSNDDDDDKEVVVHRYIDLAEYQKIINELEIAF
jgi:hypothetical protein